MNRDREHRSGWLTAAHLLVLSGFAVAQPIYDIVSANAEFLVAHDAQPVDLILLASILSCVVPLPLILLCLAAKAVSPRLGRWLSGCAVAGFASLLALLALKRLAGSRGEALAVSAVLIGIAVAVGYDKLAGFRGFLTVLTPAAILFPGLFLFFSPVRGLLLPPALADGGETRIRGDTPVIMLVLDEFPVISLLDASDRIDPVRYPNLAALAGQAYWFRNATTSAQDTTFAVPVILSGRLPDRHRLPTVADYPQNLFTLLGGGGYRVHAIESHTRLCPPEICIQTLRPALGVRLRAMATDLAVVYLHLLLPADMASGLPAVTGTWRDFATSVSDSEPGDRESGKEERWDPPWLFAQWLDRISLGDDRALYFAHLMLPHLPWKYLPSGKEYGPLGAPILPHGAASNRWGPDPWEVTQGWQRHLLQVGYVDRLIGELVDGLREADLFDRSLIVIVADHGAAFRADDRRRSITDTNFPDILGVPLLIKLPGQENGVLSDRNVESIDILPTIADVVGIDLPWPVDGQSAVDSELPQRPRKIAFKTNKIEIYGQVDLDPEAVAEARRNEVLRKLAFFGDGREPDGLFRIGRHADLFGKRSSEIPAAGAGAGCLPELEIELDRDWIYADVDLEGDLAPVHLTGEIASGHGPESDPVHLAVAVNGIVRAVTRTYDAARFSAMIPENAVEPGRNRVEIFAICGEGPGIRLQTARRRSTELVLAQTPGGEVLAAADGEIPIETGRVQGEASLRSRPIMGLVLLGSAVDRETGGPAESIVVFVDGRFVLATEPGVDPRVGRVPKNADRTEFKIRLPEALIHETSELRVFAVARGVASELAVPARPEE